MKLGESAGFNLMEALKRNGADINAIQAALTVPAKKERKAKSTKTRIQRTKSASEIYLEDLIRVGAPQEQIEAAKNGYLPEKHYRKRVTEPKALKEPAKIDDALVQAIVAAGGNLGKINDALKAAEFKVSQTQPGVTCYNMYCKSKEELDELGINLDMLDKVPSEEAKLARALGKEPVREFESLVEGFHELKTAQFKYPSQKKLMIINSIWDALQAGAKVTLEMFYQDDKDEMVEVIIETTEVD